MNWKHLSMRLGWANKRGVYGIYKLLQSYECAMRGIMGAEHGCGVVFLFLPPLDSSSINNKSE